MSRADLACAARDGVADSSGCAVSRQPRRLLVSSGTTESAGDWDCCSTEDPSCKPLCNCGAEAPPRFHAHGPAAVWRTPSGDLYRTTARLLLVVVACRPRAGQLCLPRTVAHPGRRRPHESLRHGGERYLMPRLEVWWGGGISSGQTSSRPAATSPLPHPYLHVPSVAAAPPPRPFGALVCHVGTSVSLHARTG